VLDGGSDPHAKGYFESRNGAHCKVSDSAVSCAKTAVSIEMQFGMLSRVGPSIEPRITWGAQWRHLANTIELSVCCGDPALC